MLAAQRLGVSEQAVTAILRANGLSRRDANRLLAGEFVPWEPGRQSGQARIRQAEALGEDIAPIMNQRRDAVLDAVRAVRQPPQEAVP